MPGAPVKHVPSVPGLWRGKSLLRSDLAATGWHFCSSLALRVVESNAINKMVFAQIEAKVVGAYAICLVTEIQLV